MSNLIVDLESSRKTESDEYITDMQEHYIFSNVYF
jgi:hypothetical protein